MRQLLVRPLLVLVCGFHQLLAQRPPALHGRIVDPSQRPVPRATITVSNKEKAVFQGASSDTGEFTAPLAPGRYQVVVQRDGFTEQRFGLTMLNRDQKITISLIIKKEVISVTVSDQATKLNTASDSHQDSLKLNANDLGNLPIRDGDFLSALSFFTNPSGGESPTIIVDGMERTDSVNLSPSEVSEVRLNNNAYSAEFPKPGKDRIEIDTKAGSDDFHGGFSFTTRNSIFDARNPFAATNPPFSRSGYEVNLSGPILKNKLFFFVDLDHENQQQVEPILAYLPSGLMNQQVLAPFTRDLLLGRIDWQLTETHRVSAKY